MTSAILNNKKNWDLNLVKHYDHLTRLEYTKLRKRVNVTLDIYFLYCFISEADTELLKFEFSAAVLRFKSFGILRRY